MVSVAPQNDLELKLSGETCSKGLNFRKFEKIDNDLVPDLEPILKERLPISVNIFNNCKNHSSWSQDRDWYVIGGEISSQSWIISTVFRPDHGLEVTASRPADSVATPEIRAAFSNACFIDWAENFVFICIDSVISDVVTDINVREKGNYTHIHTGNVYYMDIEDGINLNDKFNYDEGVEVKTMDSVQGTEFLLKTWAYSTEGSDKYLSDLLQRNVSAGVYVNGKIESGVAFMSHGLLGMLYTLNGNRGKGYAKSAMHFAMKRCAESGLIPSCGVEQRNEASKAFQLKIGFKFGGNIDYIYHTKSTF